MAVVAPIVVRHTFSLQDGLEDGLPIGYTPTPGDVMLIYVLTVDTGFDGATPQLDFGYDAGLANATVNMATAGDTTRGARRSAVGSAEDGAASYTFQIASPLLVWVSQDGLRGGAAVGGTQGTATLVLLIAPA